MTKRSDAVQAITSRIAASASTINETRQIPQDLIDAMTAQGLFRLLVPASVGGGELDFLEYLKITQAIAAADASAGWCFNQNNVRRNTRPLPPSTAAINSRGVGTSAAARATRPGSSPSRASRMRKRSAC